MCPRCNKCSSTYAYTIPTLSVPRFDSLARAVCGNPRVAYVTRIPRTHIGVRRTIHANRILVNSRKPRKERNTFPLLQNSRAILAPTSSLWAPKSLQRAENPIDFHTGINIPLISSIRTIVSTIYPRLFFFFFYFWNSSPISFLNTNRTF